MTSIKSTSRFIKKGSRKLAVKSKARIKRRSRRTLSSAKSANKMIKRGTKLRLV